MPDEIERVPKEADEERAGSGRQAATAVSDLLGRLQPLLQHRTLLLRLLQLLQRSLLCTASILRQCMQLLELLVVLGAQLDGGLLVLGLQFCQLQGQHSKSSLTLA